MFSHKIMPRLLLKAQICLRKTKINTLRGAPALCTFELKMRASYLVQRANELTAALTRIQLAVGIGNQCSSDHTALCAKLERLRRAKYARGFAEIAVSVFKVEESAKEGILVAQRTLIRAQR